MEIITYQSEHLPALVGLYNALIRPIPHCYPISAEELAAAFAGACGYEAFDERLIREQVFVALDTETLDQGVVGKVVMGFVHVGEGRTVGNDAPRPQGNIRFLAYPRGRREIGQALLTRAEAWVREAGLDSILVYRQAYRYPFYHFSHAYLSNHLEHVQALLLFNGYTVSGGEIFLDWPDMTPIAPTPLTDLDMEVKLQLVPGRGRRLDVTVKALLGEQEIGECVSLNARTFLNRDRLDDWIFTQWLGVAEAYQGRGIGRYLLGHALAEARKLGYRHAAISTALDNHRALLFYANFGYHAVDWTRQFSKQLSSTP